MARIILALAAAAALTSCATNYSVEPVATVGQEVRYDNGAPTTESVKIASAVRISPARTSFEDRLELRVASLNLGQEAFDIGPESVRVITSEGRPMRTWTRAMLAREAKSRARWAELAAALSATADSYAASQAADTHTYGAVKATKGRRTADASFKMTTRDDARAIALQQDIDDRTSAEMAAIKDGLAKTLDALDGHMLQRTTVDPGEFSGGIVVVDRPKFAEAEPQSVDVLVTVAGERHRFTFRVGGER